MKTTDNIYHVKLTIDFEIKADSEDSANVFVEKAIEKFPVDNCECVYDLEYDHSEQKEMIVGTDK